MRDLPRIAVGLFAFVWIVARAVGQSITVDEASTYLTFVAREPRLMFFPASNNHLLNTLLMWVSVHLFGLSEWSARLPAMLGAALYISACLALTRLAARRPLAALATMAALVLNPFVMDYLVAARGYSLALGFLMCAVALELYEGPLEWISFCLGASFLSNFSFALVQAAVLVFVAARRWPSARKGRWAVSLLAPGLAVASVALPTLVNWRSSELWYGAESLKEMYKSLGASFWDEGQWAPGTIFPLAAVSIPGVLALTRSPNRRLAVLLLGIPAAAVAVHYAAFRVIQLPLPKDRTALYIVPLVTLAVGLLASVEAAGFGEWARRGLVLTLLLADLGFAASLRLSYFREWDWCADLRPAYEFVLGYSREHCIRRMECSWLFKNSLNFYRAAGRDDFLPEFKGPSGNAMPEDRELYVVHRVLDRDFVKRLGLKIIWTSEHMTAVAVRPAVESRGGCLEPNRKAANESREAGE